MYSEVHLKYMSKKARIVFHNKYCKMKMIVKSTLAVVTVAASCLGAWRAYGVYGNYDNSLLMENLEALSADPKGEGDNGEGGGITLYDCKSPGGGKKGTAMYICAEGTTLYSTDLPPEPQVFPCSNKGIPDISLFSLKPNNGKCYR